MARLSRIAPELPASKLHDAAEYYTSKLGFHVEMEFGSGYAILERDDVAIHLFEAAAQSHSPVAIHVFTTGIEDLHAELQRRGAHISQGIERKPWGNREFRVRDPYANEIKFTEPAVTAEGV